MIAGRSVLGLVTARGGSKRLPGKHLAVVGGKPLIAWTIEAGLAAGVIDRLVLSSDSEEIIVASKARGCDAPWVRPPELATSDTPSMAVVLHALDNLPHFDYVVLLQPTSPLRTGADIDDAVTLCVESGRPACVSVCPVEKSPRWMVYVDSDGSMRPVVDEEADSSRLAAGAFMLNGALYVAETVWLRETRTFLAGDTIAYTMPKERSIDVDTRIDLRVAAMLMEGRPGECEG